MLRSSLTLSVLAAMMTVPAAPAAAQMADAEIIRVATSAAPADIAAAATVVDPAADGTMRVVRPGTNAWLCMAQPEIMCLDKAWQGWVGAWMGKTQPAIGAVGIAYMLQGDTGVSNTDPYATAETPDNAWVVSPAHIMILTPDTAHLDALPTDPSSGGPWVMWKGTPYAHIMVPTVPMKPVK
jgi:hypothetical protein